MRLIDEARYDINNLQARLVPVLERVDKVCREHNLRYYLCAGTMLGAVRHHGFIPWDDDVDICMPRPDYNLMMAHCSEWISAPMEIIGPHNRPDYPYPFAKAIDSSTTVLERPDFMFPEGIYIDIFPIDGMPTDAKKQKSHIRKYKFWRHLLFLRGRDPFKHGHGFRSWWPLLLHSIFTLKWLQNKVQNIMTEYDFNECDLIVDYDFNERGIMSKSLLGEPKPYEFAGKQFLGVADYDKYLTHLYGDYMILPPVNKQTQHCFYYIDFDTPFRNFVRDGGVEIVKQQNTGLNK